MKSNNSPKNSEVVLSKNLSRILRHEAVNKKLAVGSDGYVSVTELLALKDFKNVSIQDLKNVVYSSELKRFDIITRDGSEYIRACQGHTMPIINMQQLQKEFRELPGYNKSTNSVKNFNPEHTTANGNVSSEVDGKKPAVANVPTTTTSATSATSAPKTNAWNTKAPIFVPSSTVLANLPAPINQTKASSDVESASSALPTSTTVKESREASKEAEVTSKTSPTAANAMTTTTSPTINSATEDSLGIEGAVDVSSTDLVMPCSGVWQRTALYEPKGTLGPEAEQTLNVIWVQSKSGHYIDLRVPPVVTVEGAVTPHEFRAVKSFAGVSKFDHSTALLEWQRRMDYRVIPAKDVGHIRMFNGGKKLVEDSALPVDDYREMWDKLVIKKKEPAIAADSASKDNSVSTATEVKKLWSSIVAPAKEPAAITNASTCTTESKKVSAEVPNEASCVLNYQTKAANGSEVNRPVGYFIMTDGYFALTVDVRDIPLYDNDNIAGTRKPTVEELRAYFNNTPPAVAKDESTATPAVRAAVTPSPTSVEVSVDNSGKPPTVFSYAQMTKKAAAITPTSTAATSTSGRSTPPPPLSNAQIESYLSRYITVMGNSNSWNIVYALQTSMVGKSLSSVVFTYNGITIKVMDVLRKLSASEVFGKIPKFLYTVMKDVTAPLASKNNGKNHISNSDEKATDNSRDKKSERHLRGNTSQKSNNDNRTQDPEGQRSPKDKNRRHTKDSNDKSSRNNNHNSSSNKRSTSS